jgi:FtsZ-binding cell division protein ZapB
MKKKNEEAMLADIEIQNLQITITELKRRIKSLQTDISNNQQYFEGYSDAVKLFVSGGSDNEN